VSLILRILAIAVKLITRCVNSVGYLSPNLRIEQRLYSSVFVYFITVYFQNYRDSTEVLQNYYNFGVLPQISKISKKLAFKKKFLTKSFKCRIKIWLIDINENDKLKHI
jgi:hypothetical protein